MTAEDTLKAVAVPIAIGDRKPPARELTLSVPPALLEEVARMAAELVAERLTPQPVSEFLTVPETAEILRAKPQRVYDLLSDGRLTRLKDGSRVLISRAEVLSHLGCPSVAHSAGNGLRRRFVG